jgi:hypothetical protein
MAPFQDYSWEASMADQTSKPLERFTARRTRNGGWIIGEDGSDRGMMYPEHAFTTAADMLAALPGLIGAVPDNEAAMIARLDAARRALGMGSLGGPISGPGTDRLVPRGV